jgi:hypothetical protein
MKEEEMLKIEELAEYLYHQLDGDMLNPIGYHYSNLTQTKKRYWLILAEQCFKRCTRTAPKAEEIKWPEKRPLNALRNLEAKGWNDCHDAFMRIIEGR